MTLRRYEHLSGSAREDARTSAAHLYNSGATVREISVELGRSYGFVHRLLLESPEVVLRSRGARNQSRSVEIEGQLELTAD